jgi:plasmid stabilization system protein ParE
MSVILRRPRARDDLAEIWDYIADDSIKQADALHSAPWPRNR